MGFGLWQVVLFESPREASIFVSIFGFRIESFVDSFCDSAGILNKVRERRGNGTALGRWLGWCRWWGGVVACPWHRAGGGAVVVVLRQGKQGQAVQHRLQGRCRYICSDGHSHQGPQHGGGGGGGGGAVARGAVVAVVVAHGVTPWALVVVVACPLL